MPRNGPHCPALPPGRSRRGNVLVLVLFLIVALMGLAALVIDLGMARVAQLAMQSAADSAARVALRGRDSLPPELQGDSATNPLLAYVEEALGEPRPDPFDLSEPTSAAWLNRARRVLAQWMIDASFTGTDPTTGAPIPLSAGPVFRFAGGVPLGDTGYVALRTLQPHDGSVDGYRPHLPLNADDDPAIPEAAAGRYGLNAAYPAGEPRDETIVGGVYVRRDFVPGGDPALAGDASARDAFVIRLRRTSDNPQPNGGPIPYLFAPGNLIGLGQFGGGIPVRATAIAAVGEASFAATTYSTGRAKAVGPARPGAAPDQGIAGLAPFALALDRWQSFVAGGADQPLFVSGSSIADGSMVEWGRAIAPDRLVAVSMRLADLGVDALDPALRDLRLYVPLYDGDAAASRIVGFGFATWEHSATPVETLTLKSLSDGLPRGRVGSGNVTAVIPHGLPGTPLFDGMSAADVAELFQVHNSIVEPLRVPVLVNRHVGAGPP